jgi:hypothetical protein
VRSTTDSGVVTVRAMSGCASTEFAYLCAMESAVHCGAAPGSSVLHTVAVGAQNGTRCRAGLAAAVVGDTPGSSVSHTVAVGAQNGTRRRAGWAVTVDGATPGTSVPQTVAVGAQKGGWYGEGVAAALAGKIAAAITRPAVSPNLVRLCLYMLSPSLVG